MQVCQLPIRDVILAIIVVRNLSVSNLNVTFSRVTRTVVHTTNHRHNVMALASKALSVMVMASSAIVRAVNMVAEKAIMLVAIIVARLTAMVVVQQPVRIMAAI